MFVSDKIFAQNDQKLFFERKKLLPINFISLENVRFDQFLFQFGRYGCINCNFYRYCDVVRTGVVRFIFGRRAFYESQTSTIFNGNVADSLLDR